MERRRKYLSDIKLLVHSMRDNMRKQRLTIRKETQTIKDDLLNTQQQETEDLSEQGRRYIKEVSSSNQVSSIAIGERARTNDR